MRILAFNNNKAQNQKKQTVNFEANIFNNKTFNLIESHFPGQFKPTVEGGWNLITDANEFKNLYLTLDDVKIATDLDCHQGKSPGIIHDHLKNLKVEAAKHIYTYSAIKKAIKKGTIKELLPNLSECRETLKNQNIKDPKENITIHTEGLIKFLCILAVPACCIIPQMNQNIQKEINSKEAALRQQVDPEYFNKIDTQIKGASKGNLFSNLYIDNKLDKELKKQQNNILNNVETRMKGKSAYDLLENMNASCKEEELVSKLVAPKEYRRLKAQIFKAAGTDVVFANVKFLRDFNIRSGWRGTFMQIMNNLIVDKIKTIKAGSSIEAQNGLKNIGVISRKYLKK